MLLHGAEAGGAAVEGADGDHLGLVEVAVAAAHRAGDAEDGERLALVRLPRQRLHPPLHARRHLLRLGVRALVNPALHARRHLLGLGVRALVKPALHARRRLVGVGIG